MNEPDSTPISIDEIADELIKLINDEDWTILKEAIIDSITNEMTSEILHKITGNPVGYEEAYEFLDKYYQLPLMEHTLIRDALYIIGVEPFFNFIELLYTTHPNLIENEVQELQQQKYTSDMCDPQGGHNEEISEVS